MNEPLRKKHERRVNRESFIALSRPVKILHQFSFPLDGRRCKQLERRYKSSIENWKNGLFDEFNPLKEITCLRATDKAQIYRVTLEKGENFIYKFHAQKRKFLSEYFSVLLLEETGHVPKLLASDENKYLLVFEHLFFRETSSLNHLCDIAFHLGELHTSCYLANKLLFEEIYNDSSLINILGNSKQYSWVLDQESFGTAVRTLLSLYGNQYVPCMLGDLKSEHVYSRIKQGINELVFIDMETFQVGGIEQLDLLCLLNFPITGLDFTCEVWFEILESYLNGRGETVDKEKVVRNHEVLVYLAKSIGLDDPSFKVGLP